MDKVAKSISIKLSENNFIKKEEIDICQYGLEMFLTLILEVSAILLLSIIVGNFCETILFFVGFLPLRMYAGGYHANTRIGCFGVLILAYILFSILLIFEINKYFILSTSILSVICIYGLAPLRLKNKTLLKKEKSRYKNISTIIALVESLIIISTCVMNIYSRLIVSLFLGLLTVLISLIAGKIKDYIRRRREV